MEILDVGNLCISLIVGLINSSKEKNKKFEFKGVVIDEKAEEEENGGLGDNEEVIENGSDTWQLLVCVVAEIVKVIHSHYFFCLLF